MASIREVAKRAGVAACTVSRVMNGTASVAPETRKKIEYAMRELDYIPNELARGMFRQRAGIVAMLVPSIRHPFFASLADCIENQLYFRGYKLMLCSTSGETEREREYLGFLKSNIVDGIIMAVSSLDREEYAALEKPVVMLDYYVNDRIPLVTADHRMGGKLAAEEFIRNGCRLVLHLCDEEKADKVVSFESHLELERILREHGIESRRISISWNSPDMEVYTEEARRLLREYPDADGVMAADMAAAAFVNAALESGKKVPGEFCAVAFDGTYAADMNGRELTSVVQPVEKMAEKVVEIMARLLEKQRPKETDVRIPVTLRYGKTT